jgi:ribosomal protein L37E
MTESECAAQGGKAFYADSRKHLALIKCPECNRENYAMSVIIGICAWCGFDINAEIK